MKKNIVLWMAFFPLMAMAAPENSWRDFDFKIKMGFNLGGTSPMGLPAEIREIKSFNPLISLSLEAGSVYWWSEKWGLASGIRFENKGMKTIANVKEYNVILQTQNSDGSVGSVEGLFTGTVETKVRNGYLSIPLAVYYRLSDPLIVHLSGYYAYLLDNSFTGAVYDGVLNSSSGKPEIPKEKPMSYDFSKELNKHDLGLSGGIEWNAFRHFVVAFDLNWGLRSVFPKTFSGIGFPMYNVYANIAVGYRF